MAEINKEQVVDYLSNLPVIEIAGLVKELEEKWGVSAAPVAVAGAGGGAGPVALGARAKGAWRHLTADEVRALAETGRRRRA
jgi:large subunit ribosomal protein L7/L12